MNKDLLNNSWILAGLLLLISVVLGGILFFLGKWLNIKYITSLSGIFAALFVGQIYTSQFKEIMTKRLRLKVSSISISIQFMLSIFYGLITGLGLKKWLIISIIVCIVYFFLLYWFLAKGGKTYLTIIKKQEELKKTP